eukprot:gene18460-26029_t
MTVTTADIDRLLRATLAPERLAVEDDSHLHAGHAGAREGGHFTVRLSCAGFSALDAVWHSRAGNRCPCTRRSLTPPRTPTASLRPTLGVLHPGGPVAPFIRTDPPFHPPGKGDLRAKPDNWSMYERTIETESDEYKNLTYTIPSDNFDRSKQPAATKASPVPVPDFYT